MNSTSDSGTPIQTEFETLMIISHYYCIRCVARQLPNLSEIAVKISIALLRYSDIIPADKAYYEAGIDCKVNFPVLFYTNRSKFCFKDFKFKNRD